MVFCRYCGTKAPDDALYCGKCGKTLALPSFEQTSINQPFQASQAKSQHQDEEQKPLFVPVPEPLTSGDIPALQGTPQVGSVPATTAPVAGMAAKAGMSALAKFLIVAATCAVVIAGSVKVVPIIIKGGGQPQGGTTQIGTHTVTTTIPMPPTQISCPSAGTARAGLMRFLVLGNHQNLVYIYNVGTGVNAAPGLLKRYDIATRRATEIVKLTDGGIFDARISADGEWVLFTSAVNGQPAIQMVRMDGQGLQTLYCAPSALMTSSSSANPPISSLAWSADKQWLMFSEEGEPNDPTPPLYLMNLFKGTVQKELQSDPTSATTYISRVWIDSTHIALYAAATSGFSPQGIYVLDTNKGANQQSTALQLVVKATTACFDFDINPEHTAFFFYECRKDTTTGNFTGPSSIQMLPVTGGSAYTIFTTPTLVDTIRVISSTHLLLLTANGLYKLQTNGNGFSQIVGNNILGHVQSVLLNQFSLETWSVLARNGSMYSMEFVGCGNNCGFTLLFGSLDGGAPTTFDSGYSGGGGLSLWIVGWTTM